MTDRLHGLGIMINGSFVFGMDDDDEDVFRRTVDWAIEHGITTATFHIQTPYPGTRLFARTEADGPDPDARLGSLRHAARRLSAGAADARGAEARLRLGVSRVLPLVIDRARRRSSHGSLKHQAKHFFYAAGWKKFEPLWDLVIRARQLPAMTPLLEGVLSKVTAARGPRTQDEGPGTSALVPLDLDAVAPSFVTVHRRRQAKQAALSAVAE